MKNSFFILTLALAVSCLASAQELPTALVLNNVTIIDVTGGPEQANASVVISGNQITQIGKTGTLRFPKDARVVDGTGKFLIPGLWDMHVHVLNDNGVKIFFPLFIANGVLGVRDMQSPVPFEKINQWRSDIAAGTLLGPRFVAAGPIIDGPNPMDASSIVVANESEARQAVRSLKQRGADFVKVHNQLSRPAYFAIADETKKLGMPFAGHVPFAITPWEAADAGQKSIEHLTGVLMACSKQETELREAMLKQLAEWDRNAGPAVLVSERFQLQSLKTLDRSKASALFEHFAKHKTWQVPTLTMLLANASLNDEHLKDDVHLKYIPASRKKLWDAQTELRLRARTEEDWTERKALFQKQLDLADQMRRTGIEFMAGTDAPFLYTFPGFSLHDELALFAQAGFTPIEALQTATINPARFLGKQRDLGTVEKGKLADLVLLDANPLQNIQNTRRIAAVIVNGLYLPRSELDEFLTQAEDAASADIGLKSKSCAQESEKSLTRTQTPLTANRATEYDNNAAQEVICAEKERAQAVLRNDVASMDRLLAEEFTVTDVQGVVHDRLDELSLYKNKRRQTRSWEPSDVKVRLYGDAAVVTERAAVKDVLEGEQRDIQIRLTHVWVKRDGRWQVVARQATRISGVGPQTSTAPVISSTETSSAAEPPSKSNAEQEVRQAERELTEALSQGNFATVERIYADDYSLTTVDGELQNKAQRIAALRATDPKSVSRKRDDITLQVYGDTAVVTGHTLFNTDAQGGPKSENRRFTHVWVKRPDRWQMVSAQVTRIPEPQNLTEDAAMRREAKPEPSAVQSLPVKHLRVNGAELAYVEKGTGEPVILVHGLISDYRTWANQIDEFAKHYHVIAYSRRYHYPNAWVGDASDYSVDLHVRDLVALIQALNLGPVHLIGHSYGGRVAVLVAISHPELVRTLVVAETQFASLLKPKPEWEQTMADQKKQYEIASRAEQTGGPAEALKALFESGGGKGAFDRLPAEDRQRYLDNARTLVPARREVIQAEEFACADVQRIKAPFMWVESDSGARIMRLVGDELVKCRPQIERVTIPNAKHGMMHDNSAAFNQAVLAFLDGWRTLCSHFVSLISVLGCPNAGAALCAVFAGRADDARYRSDLPSKYGCKTRPETKSKASCSTSSRSRTLRKTRRVRHPLLRKRKR